MPLFAALDDMPSEEWPPQSRISPHSVKSRPAAKVFNSSHAAQAAGTTSNRAKARFPLPRKARPPKGVVVEMNCVASSWSTAQCIRAALENYRFPVARAFCRREITVFPQQRRPAKPVIEQPGPLDGNVTYQLDPPVFYALHSAYTFAVRGAVSENDAAHHDRSSISEKSRPSHKDND
jgi:hypothetical protein